MEEWRSVDGRDGWFTDTDGGRSDCKQEETKKAKKMMNDESPNVRKQMKMEWGRWEWRLSCSSIK